MAAPHCFQAVLTSSSTGVQGSARHGSRKVRTSATSSSSNWNCMHPTRVLATCAWVT